MARKNPDPPFAGADLEQLGEAGISTGEAARQIELLLGPIPWIDIVRPCTVGDGIVRIETSERERLDRLFAEAARSGRCGRFVPASGAATRMFHSLLHYRASGDSTRARIDGDARSGKHEGVETARFLDNLGRFAFADDLREALSHRGMERGAELEDADPAAVLSALLDPDGLGYAGRPKALLKFHAGPGGGRTPFEEHLMEAASLVADAEGCSRAHFTVAASEEHLFRRLIEETRAPIASATGAWVEAGFSHQKPSTDTLAVDMDGRPFRSSNGRLLLRPSGHGALIDNLDDLGGDIVLVKNIDNVAPDRLREPTLTWSRLLGGLALDLQAGAFELMEALERGEPDAIVEASRFAAGHFHRGSSGEPPRAEAAIALLDRPIRICGMVVNEGDPGGGPFWVRDGSGGLSLQIVEGAQINHDKPGQRAALAASTHMNPVFMACALADRSGRSYDLKRFMDPGAVIIARKSHEGRDLLALERPGLWNGAMSGWNTVFVETPVEVFNPVKTVVDLLRPAHQPA
jgi:hypothetical protein